MHKRIITSVTTVLTGAALAFGGAALAQQPAAGAPAAGAPPVPPAAGMNVPTPDYSDAQLKRFVSATQKVALISQEYTPKLEATRDESARKKVFEEADGKMVKAVHDEGMTVDQFNGINQAVQRDPELARRVRDLAG